MKTSLYLKILGLFLLSAYGCTKHNNTHTKYAMSMVFRETPYADIQGAHIVDKKHAVNKKHFELEYDDEGRLIECRYMFKGVLIPFNDRFIRAPKIKVTYSENLETRTFFNEYGHRTLVSGNVYEVQILRNERNERTSMTFHDIDGQIIENDFGIARYTWQKLQNNEVIEYRYDIDNNLTRNRPEFQYLITRFSFDANGLLMKMTNLGSHDTKIEPDQAGVTSTVVHYDTFGRLTEWSNYDSLGNLARGMTNIARINYTPSPFFSEKVAAFIDENNAPQLTNWGVHKVIYAFDAVGNEVKRSYLDMEDQSAVSASGIGIIHSTYTPDGMFLKQRAYFDEKGNPIGLGPNQIHAYEIEFDNKHRPWKSNYISIDGQLVNSSAGYATEERLFDEQGRIEKIRYLDSMGKLVNNKAIEVAIFNYFYTNKVELLRVETLDASGNPAQPQWNPNH